jgi:hypothetical protein
VAGPVDPTYSTLGIELLGPTEEAKGGRGKPSLASEGLARMDRHRFRAYGELLGPGKRGVPGQRAVANAHASEFVGRMDRHRFRQLAGIVRGMQYHLGVCTRTWSARTWK